MKIGNVFERDSKALICCEYNESNNIESIKGVIVDGVRYSVLKTDKMISITGETSVALLLDTDKRFAIGKKITVL